MKFFGAKSYAEKKKLMRGATVLAFLTVFLVLMAHILFGESGILTNLGVQAEYRALQHEGEQLKRENARLMEEIRALKKSDRKIEEISRDEFGFARPGEIVFYFSEKPDSPVQVFQAPK